MHFNTSTSPLLFFLLSCDQNTGDSLDFKGHERVGLLSVVLAVVEQDLLTANNNVL